MQRIMLVAKIHQCRLTGTDLDYEGSITIDADLLGTAGILPGEQVHVLNLATGARLETYAIEGTAGTGVVALNGAAARLGEIGDRLIILAYASMTTAQARTYEPRIVRVDDHNHPTGGPDDRAVKRGHDG